MADVQFRFGELWQYEYEIGDELRWGVNDVGNREMVARVLGYFECPKCRKLVPAEVVVDRGRITGVRVITREEERQLEQAGDFVMEA